MFPSPLFDDQGYARGHIIPYSGGINLGSESNPFTELHVGTIVADNVSGVSGALQVQAGAAAGIHQFTLVGGTYTVINANVTANTKLFLSVKTVGGTPGTLSYTIDPGVGYTVTSSSGTDTSTITALVVESIP